ncbi:MAG: serine/threonine protein kinase [Deltaproteobacteria bacterium]|nr:serine/threonine protein kinase [Deltaproteobacteria bacterium]
MGSIYEAEHTVLHRHAAVKVLHAEYAESGEAVDRFLREAMAASAIGHPNIVEVHDVGQEPDGTTFIVMELLKGQDLGNELVMEHRLVPSRVVAIVLQVLSALHEAHRKGIIHRDMKPDNVFLTVDPRLREEVKLLDFGVAKIQGCLEGTESMSLTRTGMTLGTPYYIAPEQARGRKDIDTRVDLWALGVMMYEMLSGRLPFQGEGYNEIISNVLLEDHEPLLEIAPDVPSRLAEIVERALVKDRDQRYQSAAEMIGDLLPLHDEQAAYRLTSSVDVALRRTSDPPPAPNAETVELEAYDPDARDIRESSTKTWLLNSDIPTSASRSGRKRLVKLGALAGGVVVAGLAAVALVVLPDSQPELSSDSGVAAPVEQVVESLDETDPAPVVIEKASASEPGPLPETIEVDLGELPRGARIWIDGVRATAPIVLPGSEQPVIIKITARGHDSFEKALVPDRDYDIAIELTRKQAAPAVKKKSSKKKAASRDWAENPFTN